MDPRSQIRARARTIQVQLVFSVDLVSGDGFLIGAHVDDGTQHFDARQPEKVIAMRITYHLTKLAQGLQLVIHMRLCAAKCQGNIVYWCVHCLARLNVSSQMVRQIRPEFRPAIEKSLLRREFILLFRNFDLVHRKEDAMDAQQRHTSDELDQYFAEFVQLEFFNVVVEMHGIVPHNLCLECGGGVVIHKGSPLGAENQARSC
mmetsp:Transcript_10239/g.16213  ORF Transcript_10239/g.16213 Transcript_10239/m.16213 type:complete len:203 (-) Transcript_10239:38-646(-)